MSRHPRFLAGAGVFLGMAIGTALWLVAFLVCFLAVWEARGGPWGAW